MTTRHQKVAPVVLAVLALCYVVIAQERPGQPATRPVASSQPATCPSTAPAKKATSQPANWFDACKPVSPQWKKPSESSRVDEEFWDVKFMAYGWIPSLHGHAGIGQRISGVDIGFADVIEALDKVESIAPFDLEARVGNWGVFSDLLYGKVADSAYKGPIKVNREADQTILETGGFYRVGTWACRPGSESDFTWDILGGARYNRINGEIGLQTPHHAISLGRAEEWWDPFVGSRVDWHAMKRLDFFARADVGGFGLENCSHCAWQFLGGVKYDFTKNIFAELGYRGLNTDFQTGSGRDRFTYDIFMGGPYLAIGVQF